MSTELAARPPKTKALFWVVFVTLMVFNRSRFPRRRPLPGRRSRQTCPTPN